MTKEIKFEFLKELDERFGVGNWKLDERDNSPDFPKKANLNVRNRIDNKKIGEADLKLICQTEEFGTDRNLFFQPISIEIRKFNRR